MYHRPGLGQFDLGQDIMDRPEVGGVYHEYGYGYGGEYGLGISIGGIFKGIGKGIKGVGKGIGKVGKGVFKGAKFVATKAVPFAARTAFKGAKIAAPFALPAVGGILVAKKGIPLLSRLFRKKPAAAPAEEAQPIYTTMPVSRMDEPGWWRNTQTGQVTQGDRSTPPSRMTGWVWSATQPRKLPTTPRVIEEITGRITPGTVPAEEPGEPKLTVADIGRQIMERFQPAAGLPAGGVPAEAAAGEEGVETVTRPTMAGLFAGPMPLLMLGGLALAMFAGKGGGRGRGRRR